MSEITVSRIGLEDRGLLFQEELYTDRAEYAGAEILHRHYRGTDGECFRHPIKQKHELGGPIAAIVAFHDLGIDGTFGQLCGPETVRIKWQTQSQHPSCSLHVGFGDDKGGKREAIFRIFPQSLARGFDGALRWGIGGVGYAVELLPRDDVLEQLYENGELMEFYFDLVGQNASTRPRLTGVTAQELEDWRWYQLNSPSNLDRQQLLILSLLDTCELSVYRHWPTGEQKVVDEFYKWTNKAWNMCADHGNNWFYSLQIPAGELQISSPDCRLENLVRPRWLVQEWKITDGNIKQQPIPQKWGTFPEINGKESFLDAETMGFEYRVAIAREGNSAQSRRRQNTIETIQHGVPALRQGIDIANLILHAPPAIDDTGSISHEFDPARHSEILDRSIFDNGLNERQSEALWKACCEASHGIIAITGPPGTGKSKALAATIGAHVTIGKSLGGDRRRQVLVCTPSNIAVDELMKAFSDIKGSQTLEVVRYRASLVKPQEAIQPNKISDEAIEAETNGEEEGPHLEEPDIQQHGFYRKRGRMIGLWSKDEGHPMRVKAQQYQKLSEVLRQPGLSTDWQKDLKARLSKLERELSHHYLQHSVDVVFVTNSSSADTMLQQSFRPKIVVGDEVSSTTVPDALTPVGAFLSHVELLVVAGNEHQQKPTLSSTDANEYSNLLKLSLIGTLKKSPALSYAIVNLNVQHRMHPDLSEPLSTILYKDPLINAPNVWQITAEWRTLRALFNGLGRSWNGRRRLAFDISGDDVQSKWQDTSFINVKEAEAICDIIAAALKQSPPEGGEKIVQEDITVLTPCKDQVAVIKKELAKRGLSKAETTIRVSTVMAGQSAEAKMVLLSLVMNEPDNPRNIGIIHESQLLNVAFSRAQQALIMVDEGVEIFANPGARFSTFGGVIKDLVKKRDCISYREFKRWMATLAVSQMSLAD